MHRVRLTLSFLIVAILIAGVTWHRNRPRSGGPDVPSGKLKSVSFAPFREGFSPLKEIFPLPEHLDEDLRLLAPKTESIRTYSSLGGMEPLPPLARKYGVSITQGAWLGWGEKDNQKELAALVASANTNPDVVTRLIVGNEVLLRGEMEPERLIAYIREVKRSVTQPVSYADVWSMYMKYPALINEVDFITIHILPYWEDEPISIDDATAHLEKVFRAVESEARALGVSKPIFIGESGWPSAGRQRGSALPSVVNAARYNRGLIEVANRHGFDYNIVEAFNQPWKSALEGTVGANWGLFSAAREPIYPLFGAVTENPRWKIHLAPALLLGALILPLFSRRLKDVKGSTLSLFVFFTLALSTALVTFAFTGWASSYSSLERAQTSFWIIANLILSVTILDTLLSASQYSPSTPKLLRSGYLLFALFALYRTYHLARHGRYLTFPIEQFAVPMLGIIGLALFRRSSPPESLIDNAPPLKRSRLDRGIGALLFLSAIALFFGETTAFLEARDLRSVYPHFRDALPIAFSYTLKNSQLIVWTLCLIGLGVFFAFGRGSRRLPTSINIS